MNQSAFQLAPVHTFSLSRLTTMACKSALTQTHLGVISSSVSEISPDADNKRAGVKHLILHTCLGSSTSAETEFDRARECQRRRRRHHHEIICKFLRRETTRAIFAQLLAGSFDSCCT